VRTRFCRLVLALALAATGSVAAATEDLPEYRLKAAFLYNFAIFTEWPAEVGPTLNLCVIGKDPFGDELDPLQGKRVGERHLSVQHRSSVESLKGCQAVFVAGSAIGSLARIVGAVRGSPVLIVADSPGAIGHGVALNMIVSGDRIVFDADLKAARGAGINLSSKLLRLAREVQQ
jgi:hypothetical protein